MAWADSAGAVIALAGGGAAPRGLRDRRLLAHWAALLGGQRSRRIAASMHHEPAAGRS